MFCTNCGTQNPDDAHFCKDCGKSISESGGTEENELLYAGFWVRFGAVFLDSLILTIIMFPLWILIGVIAGFSKTNQTSITVFVYLASFGVSALYFTLMESSEKSASFGKRWMGLKVLDVNGDRITNGRAFVRWISHIFSYMTLYIGFLIQPFASKKQALHDMLAGTIIVKDPQFKGTSAIVIAVAILVGLVPIVGIMAAIAIPAYQDYTIKAKVAQAEQIGRQASSAVEAFYLQKGSVPSSIEEAGFSMPVTMPYISSVLVDPKSGVVQVAFSTGAGQAIAGKSLLMIPKANVDKTINWTCSSQDIQMKYLSQACRSTQSSM